MISVLTIGLLSTERRGTAMYYLQPLPDLCFVGIRFGPADCEIFFSDHICKSFCRREEHTVRDVVNAWMKGKVEVHVVNSKDEREHEIRIRIESETLRRKMQLRRSGIIT